MWQWRSIIAPQYAPRAPPGIATVVVE
jgi:hypothetical protein